MSCGGKRAGAGRPRKDSVRLALCVPREAYDELKARERSGGRYRTQIARDIFLEALAATTGEGGYTYTPRLAPGELPEFDWAAITGKP